MASTSAGRMQQQLNQRVVHNLVVNYLVITAITAVIPAIIVFWVLRGKEARSRITLEASNCSWRALSHAKYYRVKLGNVLPDNSQPRGTQ